MKYPIGDIIPNWKFSSVSPLFNFFSFDYLLTITQNAVYSLPCVSPWGGFPCCLYINIKLVSPTSSPVPYPSSPISDFSCSLFSTYSLFLSMGEVDSSCSQTCTNSRNTSIPPGVLSFQVVFVNKFNLKEDISLLLCWPVSEGLDLISSRCMWGSVMSNSISCLFIHATFLSSGC